MEGLKTRTGTYALIAFALFAVALSSTPAKAFAADASSIQSHTYELLPPGQNTCQAVSVTSIQPYVYNGTLQSFDVTVNDASYLGILGSVGNTPIPLEYITRWGSAAGSVRIHVDTPTTPINGSLAVSLTLLSGPSGQPVCASVVSFEVSGSGVSVSVPPYTVPSGTGGTSSGAGTIPVTSSGTGSGTSYSGPTGSGTSAGRQGSSNSSSTGIGLGTAYTGSLVAAGSPITGLSNICTDGNAFRLWVILLLVYVIIVGVAVFAEPWFIEESVLGATASILVPLILLLGFWYFSEACRAASWIPVVACVIAVVGLFLVFREYETMPVVDVQ